MTKTLTALVAGAALAAFALPAFAEGGSAIFLHPDGMGTILGRRRGS